MEYFKKYFKEVNNWNDKEIKVLCPFHADTHPSASINTDKSLFHCWVCDLGYNEEQFVARVNNVSTTEAVKLLDRYNCDDDWDVKKGSLWADETFLNKVKQLGLSEEIINEFNLGLVRIENTNKKMLGIPIYYNNILVDVRKYNLLKYENFPKCSSNENAESGWIVPYDTFLNSDEPCYLFEGEKDMLIAREHGINAFTLVSGAGATPNNKVINSFKDKDIIMCYDNDDAGRKGMISVFKSVKDLVKSIRYVNIGDVVNEEKEDFYDYITKYNGDAFEFYTLEQHQFTVEDVEEDKKVTIQKALGESKLRKKLRSVVTVTSEFADPYAVPTIVEFEKKDEMGSKSEVMYSGEKRTWFLEDNNMVQMLELIETCAKDTEIKAKLKTFVGIPGREPMVEMKFKELKTVYKCTITDKDIDKTAQSVDMYSFEKLDVGGQYIIDYRLFPHPTKHQKLVAVCTNCTTLHDNKNYQVNKELLSMFQKEGTIEEKLDYQYQSAKHYIAKHLSYNIWLMCDLVFNSVLDFNYDGVMRGCLDIFILGDTQVGKSETANALVDLYNFGHFLSLKTSTTVGLIGGSSKVDGAFCNTIGAIPRQHKRLAVLEEFSGARQDFIKTMTDIRSSNELRLARVSGELVVPCKLRMITISNPINDDNGNPRHLNTFPNGIMPLMELIKSAEDVARYDGFLLAPKSQERINPFACKLVGTPIPREAYQHKVNWVATRKPENVVFKDGADAYIWETAEKLNSVFECNFPLFGTTTSKKLARFCVALAALIVSVDDSYENIVVTKEIVDYMAKYLISIYDSSTFKLKEYADEYKAYNECTDKDIKVLQDLYANNSTMFNFLNGVSRTSRANLASISGMEASKFHPIFNKLAANKFIRLNMDNIYPTDKFRKAFNAIDKSFVSNGGSLIDKYNEPEEQTSGVVFLNDLEE
jgi:hypothetical protein